MELGDGGSWSTNWAWGLPLIVLTTVIHVLGLGFINEKVASTLQRRMDHRRFTSLFAVAMSVVVLLVTVLHAFEAALWAAAYVLLGARPDPKSAMLYSLSALTSYGHANVFLERHWQMMGALESLNGMLLFGLTTAFLFSMIQRVWPLGQQGPALALVTSTEIARGQRASSSVTPSPPVPRPRAPDPQAASLGRRCAPPALGSIGIASVEPTRRRRPMEDSRILR